ncbi:hypothetical protein ACEWPM_012930 [Roseovarius sp. S4756]|uniref:hypothetical protein n=1 Tax=Roseovarius maritimus TaxID=3342637 RepID=UPI00372A1A98
MTLSGFTAVESLRDPAQQTGQSSSLGFLSSNGTWFWVAAAAVCLFGYTLQRAPGEAARPHGKLLFSLAVFSLVLGVDDFFLIHDRYVAEGILLPAYALFILWIARRHWALIRDIDAPAFLMTGGFLALSVAVDAVQEILPIAYGGVADRRGGVQAHRRCRLALFLLAGGGVSAELQGCRARLIRNLAENKKAAQLLARLFF